MSENRKAAIYHRVSGPTYQDVDFYRLHYAHFLAQHKGFDVILVQPAVQPVDQPIEFAWKSVRSDFRDGRFDALIVSGVADEPIVYEQVPEEPDDALYCHVADRALPEPPCGLERPCPVHDADHIA